MLTIAFPATAAARKNCPTSPRYVIGAIPERPWCKMAASGVLDTPLGKLTVPVSDDGQFFYLNGHQFSNRGDIDELCEILEDPDIILDCGAGNGSFAEAMLSRFNRVQLISLEPLLPMPESTAHGDRWRWGSFAVHSIPCMRWFNVAKNQESSSFLEANESPFSDLHKAITRRVVDCTTVDDMCEIMRADDRLSLVKMDLQGWEIEALRGSQRLLAVGVPFFLEVNFIQTYKGMPLIADVDAYMAQHGYMRTHLWGSGTPQVYGNALYMKPI